MTITTSAIVAMSRNSVIGKDNKLLWHIPEDFKHFKNTTMGKPVIMGRKTYASIGKPLPGRANIVITSKPEEVKGDVIVAVSLAEGVIKATGIAQETGVDEIFIIGGGQIYDAAMEITDRIYLTVIDKNLEGDTFFPQINPQEWSEETIATATDPVPYTISVLNRKK